MPNLSSEDLLTLRMRVLTHLDAARTAITVPPSDRVVRNMLICGHLAYAADICVPYSQDLANEIRNFRIDCIEEREFLKMTELKAFKEINALINTVADAIPESVDDESKPQPKAPAKQAVVPKKCGCQNKK